MAMSRGGLSVAQAAKSLGVSVRTVRRFIKAGKVEAKLVSGPFGPEYRILAMPASLRKRKPVDNTPGQSSGQNFSELIEMVRELQEKNLALAAQLGVATERIRNMESEMRLLTAGRRPWWKRLLGIKG